MRPARRPKRSGTPRSSGCAGAIGRPWSASFNGGALITRRRRITPRRFWPGPCSAIFARAESARGRLRSFLLTSLRNFLVDEVRRGRAVPPLVTMDDSVRETAAPADAAFERQWAEALLARVLAELELEFARRGKGALFRRIESRLLATEAPEPYADVAVELGLTEQAVKAEVYRLRQRFRQLVRDEVARTVTTAAEIEEELQVLFRAYRR